MRWVGRGVAGALALLVDRLTRHSFELLDVQWLTPHLERFGAIAIPRREYLTRLARALKRNCEF